MGQLYLQFLLMMWRNNIIKKRKLGDLVKGLALPLLVFAVLSLLYWAFPDLLGQMKTVSKKYKVFTDDSLYIGYEGKDDDHLFGDIETEVLDVSLNSYLEQVSAEFIKNARTTNRNILLGGRSRRIFATSAFTRYARCYGARKPGEGNDADDGFARARVLGIYVCY